MSMSKIVLIGTSGLPTPRKKLSMVYWIEGSWKETWRRSRMQSVKVKASYFEMGMNPPLFFLKWQTEAKIDMLKGSPLFVR